MLTRLVAADHHHDLLLLEPARVGRAGLAADQLVPPAQDGRPADRLVRLAGGELAG
jgi:hypothetical protein